MHMTISTASRITNMFRLRLRIVTVVVHIIMIVILFSLTAYHCCCFYHGAWPSHCYSSFLHLLSDRPRAPTWGPRRRRQGPGDQVIESCASVAYVFICRRSPQARCRMTHPRGGGPRPGCCFRTRSEATPNKIAMACAGRCGRSTFQTPIRKSIKDWVARGPQQRSLRVLSKICTPKNPDWRCTSAIGFSNCMLCVGKVVAMAVDGGAMAARGKISGKCAVAGSKVEEGVRRW